MSPRLNVDLTEAQKREPLPDDTYHCSVLEITGPHKGEKSSYVTVKFEVAEGGLEKRQIWQNMPINGKGAGIFAEFYEKLTGQELVYGEAGIDIDTDELIGQEIGVVTVQREYPEGSGEFVTDVKKLVPIQS